MLCHHVRIWAPVLSELSSFTEKPEICLYVKSEIIRVRQQTHFLVIFFLEVGGQADGERERESLPDIGMDLTTLRS